MNDQDDFFNIDYEGYAPLEILLEDPENFLKVKETLSRIGVASKKTILYTSLVTFCTNRADILSHILKNCLH